MGVVRGEEHALVRRDAGQDQPADAEVLE